MKDISKILAEIKPDHNMGLVMIEQRDNWYWLQFPAYANLFIRKPYEMITDMGGLLGFCHYFLIENSGSINLFKILGIEAVVFHIHNSITGRNYDTDQFRTFGHRS